MLLFLNFFKNKTDKENNLQTKHKRTSNNNEKIAIRKGELGEYKIDIQLDQLPKEYKTLSDLLVKNERTKSGYSQIDHIIITPYGIIVIETKNYQGTIYGGKDRSTWIVNGKFKMMNPFVQNYGHICGLKNLIDKRYHNLFISMVSFTKRSTFKVDLEYRKIQSNELIVYDVELSEYINRKVSILKLQHKDPLLNEEEIVNILQAFTKANITDSSIRDKHLEILQETSTSSQKDNENSTPGNCVVCKKIVTDKVKRFCLSNKKFNGKIYCYDHQKGI